MHPRARDAGEKWSQRLQAWRAGACRLMDRLLDHFPWLCRLWVDGGFSGPNFADWVGERWPGLDMEVVKRIQGSKGFNVLPRRWAVERSFAWLFCK